LNITKAFHDYNYGGAAQGPGIPRPPLDPAAFASGNFDKRGPCLIQIKTQMS
jgi:hypothetical protein